MSKIQNDKYYTPIDVANYCFDKVISIIGKENISEIVEPSCGNGSFYHYSIMPDIGYDIKPECKRPNIFTKDYLTINIDYKPKRLIIGNPPYGRCLSTAQQFYKKSCKIADYIAFILPISQLNNSRSLFEFDLIYSEDLGVHTYTDRDLHCCFNIYKRPKNGTINAKPKAVLNDVKIYRQDSKGYEDKPYDIRMCYWGDGSAGKILDESEHYSAEYKIQILNENLKPQIVDVLTNFNWSEYLKCIAMRKIQQFHIIDILKDNIKDIE